jgi:hypothetical protein
MQFCGLRSRMRHRQNPLRAGGVRALRITHTTLVRYTAVEKNKLPLYYFSETTVLSSLFYTYRSRTHHIPANPSLRVPAPRSLTKGRGRAI